MKKNQFYILQFFLFGCLWLSSIASFSQTAVLFNVTNFVQTAPNAFRYDVMMTNTGTTAISLRGYSWGLNTATGIANGGTISQTFISRDASIDAGGVPAPSAPAVTLQTGTCAGAYHLRFTTLNAAGNGAPITANVPIRLATIQVQTSASSFPLNFNPFTQCSTFAPVQNIVTAGKTACVATCIVTPPATSYQINGTTSSAATGTLQALTATMTPNPASVSPFILNPPACVPVITNVSATACNTYTWSSPAGNGSTYTASGTYIKTTVKSAYCYDTTYLQLTINNNTISSSTQTACNAYTWPANGMTYTASGAYTSTSLNAVGCVNTATLNLIMNNTTSSISQTTCNSFTWSANGMTYTTSGAYTSTSLNASGCVHTTTLNLTLNATNSCNVALQLKLFIQGYYDQASTMLPVLLNQLASTDNTLTDTILVELHSALFPYGLEISQQAILHTNGTAACTFNYVNGTYSSINGANYLGGNLYYVAIRHRNGLLTWSANPIAFDSTTVVYDFSSSSSKAYGDNMLEVDPGVWAMYSADLNQDQNVDLLDMPILEADVAEYMYGYAATDLNGDGNTDLLDVIYMDYGIAHYLFSIYPVSATLPTVSTNAISNITFNTASSGGIISNNGGAVVSARGVCWSTLPNPTASLSTKTLDGSGSGPFSSNITGLVAGAAYYVRAYATNSVGTAYGSQVVFTTTAPTLPTLTTTAISAITNATASSGGSISSNGGAAVTARGVVWSTSSNPTIALSTKTIDGSGLGTFTSSITGLVTATTYYVRAYATNSVGTAYGSQLVATSATLAVGQSFQGGIIAYILQLGDPGYDANVPNGLIAAPSDQSTGAEWGCDGTLMLGASATALGTGNMNTIAIMNGCSTAGIAAKICGDLFLNGYSDWYLPSKDELDKLWQNQFIIGGFAWNASYWSSSFTISYAGTAFSQWFTFYQNQNGAHLNNLLFVRAVRSFSTTGVTTNITSIQQITATCGGLVVSQDSASVTSRGVCWSTSPNPTVALSTKTSNGSGIGSFTSSIAGLNSGTTYHVRAYATSSVGTVYGNDMAFATATATAPGLTIGQSFQGGIIAYFLQPGDPGYDVNVPHGLIVAPIDQSAGAEWGCDGVTISGADGTNIGTGNQNTIDIINGCSTTGIAARLCGDLVLNGYNDWYLPSKDELNKLWLNRSVIGGFAATNYYSSSEYNTIPYGAWMQYFGTGSCVCQGTANKSNLWSVRAVRSF